DAAAHRQHQRPPDCCCRPQISLAAPATSRRASVFERSRSLRRRVGPTADCRSVRALALNAASRQKHRMYSVKEIYYTLQGEGIQTGRPAVFCRFAGCNLWTGREADRARATCSFCDTDFVGTDGPGGGKFADAASLAQACRSMWRGNGGTPPFVVLTGGEPMLQVDEALIA